MSHGQATRSTRGVLASDPLHVSATDLCLRAEDDERAEREHAEEREERCRDGRPSPRGARTQRQRREESEDHEKPEHDPYAEHFSDGAGDRKGDEEDRDQDRLEDHEVPVRRLEAHGGIRVDVTARTRSEEHTSELQSHHDLVCRLLLEKKKKKRLSIFINKKKKKKITKMRDKDLELKKAFIGKKNSILL